METVVIEKFDELGRIFIPSGIRELMFGTDNTTGMPVKILINGDSITLQPNGRTERR